MTRPVVLALLVTTAAFAEETVSSPAPLPSEAEGTAIVQRWQKAQNEGDFAAYQEVYAQSFTGIRRSGTRKATFDRAGWLKDRERMFKKKMTVTIEKLKLAKTNGGLVARFVQTWESGNYRDSGNKEMLLVHEGAAIKIGREEQLSSRRLGVGGAPTLVVWPAKTKESVEAAQAELSQLTSSLGMIVLPAGHPRVVDGVGVVIAACSEADLEPVLSVYHALAPHVESQPAPVGTAAACPALQVNSDTNTGWTWPQISDIRAGRNTLTLLAWQRDEDEAGDFARNYRETSYLAVLRGPDGALLDSASGGSGKEFAWFTNVEPAGSGLAVREELVDDPCDGLHTHRQHRFERMERFMVKDGKIAQKETGKRQIDTVRCSNEEAQLYR